MSAGDLLLIPAYQAERWIAGVLEGVRRCAPSLSALVVDDGSRDKTSGAARAAGAEVLRHAVNRGKGAALRTGFAEALARGARGVLTMDADGQHPPECLPVFLEASRNADLVLGCRMLPGEVAKMPWLRRQTNRTMSRVLSGLARVPIRDTQCGYRWISARVLREVPLRSANYELESEILVRAGRAGFRIAEVQVPAVYAGEASHIRKGRDTLRFLRLVAGFV